MIPLIVIRPQPGGDATVAAAQRLGLEVAAHPLFAVHALEWTPPEPAQFDAMLIGSANALRHGGAGLEHYRTLPVYAVGETTADAARAAGMTVAAVGAGGMQPLLASLQPGHRRLLRLTGRERMDLRPPAGTTITDVVTFASKPMPMNDELALLLKTDAIVLLHSGEAGRHFASQCDLREIDRKQVALAALAPRIAELAGPGWAAVDVAPMPRDEALLALAGRMCQSPPGQDR